MTTDAQALSSSMENYLETIFLLVQDGPVAGAKDISQRLKVNQFAYGFRTVSEP